MNATEIKVGTIATVKVGRNEVEVTVTEITATGWKVKSNTSGREFEARKLERIISEPEAVEAVETEAPAVETAAELESPTTEPEAAEEVEAEEAAPVEPEESAEEDTPNPAPETAAAPAEKKLSLVDAAARVLKETGAALNCKEIIKQAIEAGLWIPTAAKTPEQSLYSAMFREIKNKAPSRFRKSESRKGSFEFNQ